MRINTIVAMSENHIIGKDGDLPWHISEDLKRFKRITSGHPIIMGRTTYESIGKALPGRTNIVLSRQSNFKPEGVCVVGGIDEALEKAQSAEGNDEVFIIGGGHIYREFLDKTERFHLTFVKQQVDGDASFPELDWDKDFILVDRAEGATDALEYEFLTYDRK